MPKQGTRTFPNLLRTFGIAGQAGRRLMFALGNDISPVVNADRYDPMPQYHVNVTVAALAGHRSAVELQAPDDRPINIVSLWFQSAAFYSISETLFPVGTGARSAVDLTQDFVASHGLPATASLTNATLQVAPLPNCQWNSSASQILIDPFVIGPGRVLTMFGVTNSVQHVNVIWYEPRQLPPRG